MAGAKCASHFGFGLVILVFVSFISIVIDYRSYQLYGLPKGLSNIAGKGVIQERGARGRIDGDARVIGVTANAQRTEVYAIKGGKR